MYKAKVNGDIGVKGVKVIGDSIPLGYELTGKYFVDNSGLGSRGESALVFTDFLSKVKAGFYYGISEVGQFQVYISEFKKVSRAKCLEDSGIESSKLVANNTRLTIFKNGDKVLRLHKTDVIRWQGDKIILSSGGWKTKTTKDRINAYINKFNTTNYSIYQKKGAWYIVDGDKILDFVDGIEL
jgi:hypothetical protein